jgi:hypothetical protein
VERDVEGLVEAVVLLEVGPLGGPGDEDEVARRRDRQQLGEALDDAEHERLPVRERVGIVPHSEECQDEGETERRSRDAEDERAAHGRILRGRGWSPSQRNRTQIAAIR